MNEGLWYNKNNMLDPVFIKTKIKDTIESPFNRPTDIIGFEAEGKSIARAILPIIGIKEICFFDEKIKSDPQFHYLDFDKMLAKTEIMIFTKELPNKYWHLLNQVNQQVTIFIPGTFQKTILTLIEHGYGNNLILL